MNCPASFNYISDTILCRVPRFPVHEANTLTHGTAPLVLKGFMIGANGTGLASVDVVIVSAHVVNAETNPIFS